MIFIDTSGLIAVLNADDDHHARAARAWRKMLDDNAPLITSNYVIIETTALLQHRAGIEAARLLHEDVVPCLEVAWIEADLHAAAVTALLAAGRKRLSLVDCTSFALMRQRGLKRAFTLDRHFREQGFTILP